MAYRIEPKKEKRTKSTMQKLTTPSDIYWDGETSFDLAWPIFYVEASNWQPHTKKDRNRIDHLGWPTPNHPDMIDQRSLDWRNKMHLHDYMHIDNHDGVQYMAAPHGYACTGRHDACHDYRPRPYKEAKTPICVNCLNHVIPVHLEDEGFSAVEMKVLSATDSDFNSVAIVVGEIDDWVVRVHLDPEISEHNMSNLELHYTVKVKSPYIYTDGPGSFTGPPEQGKTLLHRPRVDTVAKGRIFIDPSIENRLGGY